jgi:hypothetical protein
MTAQAWAVPAEMSDWVACSGVPEGASPLSADTIFGIAVKRPAKSMKTTLRPKPRRANDWADGLVAEMGLME